MDTDRTSYLEDERNKLIFKSNDLIRKSQYRLTMPETRTLSFICKNINSNKADATTIIFSMVEFHKVMHLEYNGRSLEETQTILLALRNYGFWLSIENTSKRKTVAFLNEAEYDSDSGLVTVKINEELMPYFLKVKEGIEYPFKYSLEMKNKYCIPLYEILKSYPIDETFTMDVSELKDKLNITSKAYIGFTAFRRGILEKAIKAINDVTDIMVSYKPHAENKTVTQLIFTVTMKPDVNADMAFLEVKAKRKRKSTKSECKATAEKSNPKTQEET